jgi:hypothetical protein
MLLVRDLCNDTYKGSATQIYHNKKGKKAKKSEKRKKKVNLLYVLKEGRARTNRPSSPIPSLPFYFRLKESLSQKEKRKNKARKK